MLFLARFPVSFGIVGVFPSRIGRGALWGFGLPSPLTSVCFQGGRESLRRRPAAPCSILDFPLASARALIPGFRPVRVVSLADLRAVAGESPAPVSLPSSLRQLLDDQSSAPVDLRGLPAWHQADFRCASLAASPFWPEILAEHPDAARLLSWIYDGVRFEEFARPFVGSFGGREYGSALPPPFLLPNHPPARPAGPFYDFVRQQIGQELASGSIRRWGVVGVDPLPRCVQPVGVEPHKPRKVYDQRYGNCWCVAPDTRYDTLYDLARVVPGAEQDPRMITWDHKSGYFHVGLHPSSQTFFGFAFDGIYYVYTVLPFGWNCSPYVYQTLSLAVGAWLKSVGIPNFDYLDDSINVAAGSAAMLQTRAVKGVVLFLLGYFVSHKSSRSLSLLSGGWAFWWMPGGVHLCCRRIVWWLF